MAPVNMYALPYQPISSIEWNSLVMPGMAVAMIIRSCWGRECEPSAADTSSPKLTNATRKIDAYMPMMIIQNLGDLGWKFFSASPFSSSSSKGRGAVGGRCVDCRQSAEDMVNHTAGTMK